MKKTYIDSVNEASREAVMRLYGSIGGKIDEDFFANELASLDDQDYESIRIRINSPGGSVYQGMSIVSAILSMHTPVVVHIDGVAASMAAVVAVAADRVIMMDFAKMMIHDPYLQDAKKMTPKQKKALIRYTDMLRGVLSRRGNDEEQIARLMHDETWLSAEEALEAGLCDEIASSARNEYMNLDPQRLVAAVQAEYENETTKQSKMEHVNLSAEANIALGNKGGQMTEDAVSESIVSVITGKNAEIEALKQERDKALEEVQNFRKEREASLEADAKAFAEQLVKEGKIDATAKEATIEMFKANPENARIIFNSVSPRTRLSGMTSTATGDSARMAAMSWDELDKAGMLAKLRETDPDLYDKKYKEMAASLRINRG